MKCSCCGREGNQSPCLECQVEAAERKLSLAEDRISVLQKAIRRKNRKIRELELWKEARPE